MTDPLPCGYTFALSGGRCGTLADHAVHVGGWTGPEPQHTYQPEERRKGERRATRESRQPSVEAGWLALAYREAGGAGTWREGFWERVAAEYARLASDPAPAAEPDLRATLDRVVAAYSDSEGGVAVTGVRKQAEQFDAVTAARAALAATAPEGDAR